MPPARWLCLLALLLPASAQETDPLAARTKGRTTAPVTVYEMADFQCPACRRFALTTLPLIDRDYIQTGKVRWVFVNFPLTQIHRNALADSVGVGHDALVKCLDTRATVDAIAQDAQGSRRAGANATPSFYIEGGLAEAALPLTEFSRILDSVYRVKTGAPPPQRP
jgi:protein-disulfide isomerase